MMNPETNVATCCEKTPVKAESNKMDKKTLSKQTVASLRTIAKSKGLANYSTLKKEDLVNLILYSRPKPVKCNPSGTEEPSHKPLGLNLVENVKKTILAKSSYDTKTGRKIIGGNLEEEEINDIFITRLSQISMEELSDLLCSRRINLDRAAARFCALELMTRAIRIGETRSTAWVSITRQLYDALGLHDFDKEIIDVITRLGSSVSEIYFSGEEDISPIKHWTVSCLAAIENDPTALSSACRMRQPDIALHLISTNYYDPGFVGKKGETALMSACKNNMPDVALALIATKRSNPGLKSTDEETTALLLACENKMTDVALALIKTNEADIGHADTYGFTALTRACQNNMSTVALTILKSKDANPGQANVWNVTPLIYACKNKMVDVARALIATKNSHPEYTAQDCTYLTALMIACQNNLSTVALDLIATGQSKPGQTLNNKTPLMMACENKMTDVALALIATNNSKPEQGNLDFAPALMTACENNMESVALALIQTKKSNPGYINKRHGTALMIACKNGMSTVALELIKIAESNPAHVDDHFKTALIYACSAKMANVAIALIKTGKSNSKQVDEEGNNALVYACQNKMTRVIDLLS